MPPLTTQRFILASSSPYRAELLRKIIPQFECISPNIDETPQLNESPQAMVKRLAEEKAHAIRIQAQTPALIIASDQCACFNGETLGKPHTHENAVNQLTQFSGAPVTFYTSLCVLDTESDQSQTIVEPFTVYFRELSHAEINAYLEKEMPYNCAGSFKSEGLGATLFDKLEGDDPNSLIGLPLIKLNKILIQLGVNILLEPTS